MSRIIDLAKIYARSVRGLREDTWVIKSVDAENPHNYSILDRVPVNEGPLAVNEALERASQKTGLPLAPNAKFSGPAPIAA